MFLMRPAEVGDRDGVAAMVGARVAWMREQNLRVTDDAAEATAEQAGDPDWPVWVLEDEVRILGCTTALEESPAWAFTEAELEEPTLFLASTWTQPTDGRHLGHVIARWALDFAAHTGKQHVRRGCFHERLARYYRDVQKWTLLRTLERRGRTAYIMSRPAEAQLDLPVTTAN